MSSALIKLPWLRYKQGSHDSRVINDVRIVETARHSGLLTERDWLEGFINSYELALYLYVLRRRCWL